MGSIIYLVVIATSIWVLVDAKTIGVRKGQIKGIGNLGPWGWFFVCLLLWIIGFPFYLAKRGEFKRINEKGGGEKVVSPELSGGSSIGDIEKLAALKEKGLITDKEFEAKKKQILGLDDKSG